MTGERHAEQVFSIRILGFCNFRNEFSNDIFEQNLVCWENSESRTNKICFAGSQGSFEQTKFALLTLREASNKLNFVR
jgi:hypothetical protein